MNLDLRPFVDSVAAIVASHRCGGPGEYARWRWQSEVAGRDLGINEYGCADAANLLYTIGQWPAAAERDAWVETLRRLQRPDDGLYVEATHDPIHTTAHCIAALELFDARPTHRLSAFETYAEPAALTSFLSGLEWTWNPWGESHKGAGLYAACVLAGEATAAWQEAYFRWLWAEADPVTGLWRRGCIAPGGEPMAFHHLAGTFHYLFNHEYAHQPLRFPEELLNTCLRIEAEGSFPLLGKMVGFAEVDWIYTVNRARRQVGTHFAESQVALQRFGTAYVDYLLQLDPHTDEGLNDLHQLFGAMCALAELQQAVPGMIRTDPPLRLVLDRRPFI